jgi:hypothetical protein
MNPKELSIGMRVVVIDEPDAHIYTIAKIDGFDVELVYPLKNGQIVNGGTCDASYIKRIVS